MSRCLSTTICLPFIGGLRRNPFSSKIQRSRQPRISIDILDDDSLLCIFFSCRPSVLVEGEYGDDVQWGNWHLERWWYKLVQVCRRWRYLILESASHLRLCLVCTPGTPVADMLAHSPPLPLIVDYKDNVHDVTVEDEEGIILVLQHRDRVQRIALQLSVPTLQKIITAMDDEFPMLEFLAIQPPTKHRSQLILPPMFEAPQLRHLILDHGTSPIGSPFLTTAVGLVNLFLRWIYPSTYHHPDNLLRSLSLLPQLERLEIGFNSPVPSRDIVRQLSNTPVVTHTALSNLRVFIFRGICAYLEALLPQMTTPLLETLDVQFFNQLSFPIPHLLQFLTTTEKIRLNSARFLFHHEAVAVFIDPDVEAGFIRLCLGVICEHLDWQISSVAQIFNVLSPLFSDVTNLILDHRDHSLSSEWHNELDRTLWRELLRTFSNVKTLRVHKGIVGDVSRSLQLDGEPPLELLPELKVLTCPTGSVGDKTFASFIHDREVAGQPVKLIEEAIPVGQDYGYEFFTSTGFSYIAPDPEPLP